MGTGKCLLQLPSLLKLGPPCPSTGARGQRRLCRVLGQWGGRKRAPRMNGVLALLPSIPARACLRMVLSLWLLRGLIAPLIDVQRFQHTGMLWGEKPPLIVPSLTLLCLKCIFSVCSVRGPGAP